MKKILTLFFFLFLFSASSFSQQFEWVKSNPLEYNLNPSLPANMVSVSEAGPVYTAYTDSSVLIYGSDIYGRMGIDCYDASGILQWTIYLGNKVIVSSTVSDQNGNVYIGGSYMETLSINGTDSLLNTGSGFDINTFLLCFSADGNMVWKRNVSLEHDNYLDISVLTMDPQNNLWYGASDFFSAGIYKTDASGNDVMSYDLTGAKTLGGISFDAAGNLYISGATGAPSMSVAGLAVAVPESYMMYVARINTSGLASWVQLATDVTFQSPQVKADPWGYAYVSGSLFTATSFGNVSFMDPQWLYDVFITRVDPDGNFEWGVQSPQSSSGITGDFDRGINNFMDVDANGNLYITGITRGTLDWGNGVNSGGGAISFGTFSILSFDTSGTPLWASNGGSELFNLAGSLAVSGNGDCYFSESIIDTATFGNIQVNAGGDFASVIGKISMNLATGIPAEGNDPSFSVYPNPVADFFNIEFFVPQTEAIEISLLDINGRRIKLLSTNNLNQGKHILHFDRDDIASGVYLLQLQSPDGSISRKMLVE